MSSFMKNGVIDMTVLRIKWAGFCPKCDSDELDVHTDKGTSQFLYAGDGVVCSECGKKGEIDCDDDHAFAVWDWED
nr:MAG TPA: HTH-type transcriptional regulator [Caudoviricetes sp.]